MRRCFVGGVWSVSGDKRNKDHVTGMQQAEQRRRGEHRPHGLEVNTCWQEL